MCSPTCENSALYYFEGAEALNKNLTAQIQFSRLPFTKAGFNLKTFRDKSPGLTITQVFEILEGEIKGLPSQLTTWQALHIIEASNRLLPNWLPLESIISEVPDVLEFINDLAAQHTDDSRQMQKFILLTSCLNRLQSFYCELLQKAVL